MTFILYITSANLKPGMILAADLHISDMNPNSAFVLTKGQKLNDHYIDRIIAYKIEGAYIEAEKHSNSTKAEMSEEIIKLHTLMELKQVFNDFKTNSFVLDSMHLKRLSCLAVDLVRFMLTKKDFSMNLLDLRSYDDYTFHHSLSVAVLSITTGIKLELPRSMLNEIAMSALLHDIGKMMIPIELLNKPDALTKEEFRIIQRHPIFALKQLSVKDQVPAAIINAVEHHHEKFDGTGYPHGIKGKDIPFISRILTICDVYDALTSNRPYRRSWFPGDIIEYMMAGSEVYFDQEILTAFLRSVAIYPVGSYVSLSNGKKAIVTKNLPECNLRPIVRIVNQDGSLDQFINLLYNLDYTNVIITDVNHRVESLENHGKKAIILNG